MLFGPNGTGKGTRFLIPNLLSIKDRSIVVIDPKGELAAVTADYRRTVGDVVMLDPFNVLGLGSAGFNPLALLDPARRISMTTRRRSAKPLSRPGQRPALGRVRARADGCSHHVGENQKPATTANLENVRGLLTEADELERSFDKKGKATDTQIKGLAVTAANMVDEGGYEIASLAARFTEKSNELASVRSTADTQTRWILSPPMREDLKKNGVDFRRLKERVTTVYVILPAERMRTHSVWLRLVIVSALRALYRAGGLAYPAADRRNARARPSRAA